MNFHLSLKSSNMKTGPIPVSSSSRETCPDTCKLKNNGCYAEIGPMRIHWDKITNKERGASWEAFLLQLKTIPKEQIWRHNQAGDLVPDPYIKEIISSICLKDLYSVNKAAKIYGFTYTHYPVLMEQIKDDNKDQAAKIIYNNKLNIQLANLNGFTVNLSANNLNEADEMYKLKFCEEKVAPVVTILPSEYETKKKLISPAGNLVLTCPAFWRETTCEKCKMCAYPTERRKFIIGFPAHGVKKRTVDRFIQISEEIWEENNVSL